MKTYSEEQIETLNQNNVPYSITADGRLFADTSKFNKFFNFDGNYQDVTKFDSETLEYFMDCPPCNESTWN